MMIQDQHIANLTGIDLGEFKPKPTGISGDPMEASKIVWTSPDGTVMIGVWECTPGTFSATRVGYSEVAHIIAGDFRLTDSEGTATDHGPGDLVVTNEGWVGTWDVRETVRKVFVIHRPATGQAS